jgi:subtilisin family serine protease
VSKDRRVAWSQPLQVFETQGPAGPNDPLFRAEPAATRWRLADLHRLATGRGARIAVVDSKIDVTHPDLSGQFAADRDFVGDRTRTAERHGTAVAGVIAAKANNGLGGVGIAPGARIMALRACWQTAAGPTLCNSLSLARAVQFAIEHKAEVINLSLSGPPDPLLRKLLELAVSGSARVVAAFDPKLPRGGFPASQPGVIAVADESLRPLPPRVYGAPGRNVPTTEPGGKWDLVSGNSYAAAHVSGLAALAFERSCSAPAPVVIARSASGAVDACTTLLRTPPCRAGRLVKALACQ